MDDAGALLVTLGRIAPVNAEWLPLLLISWSTLLRKPAAIWAGVIVLPTITAFCLAMALGLNYDLGGLYAEPGSVPPVFSLGVVRMGLGWFYYRIAVVAFYSNRNAMRWSRVATGAAPSGMRRR